MIGSILSYANGYLASPYAVSKAGVEALGRALRTELAPFGASATVAYFGWVDTELVRGVARSPGGGPLAPGNAARLPAQADHPRGGRRGAGPRNRGAGARGSSRPGHRGATSRPCEA